ncbi:Mobile element protein [Streptococcus pneumoniae]|nr:Mobile element protein [Streptococcus pneumoniae]
MADSGYQGLMKIYFKSTNST